MTYVSLYFYQRKGRRAILAHANDARAPFSPVHPSPASPNLLQAPCTLQAPFVCQKSVTPIILQRLVEGVFRNAADAFSRHAERCRPHSAAIRFYFYDGD
jgi:hypothetical protein